jgi:hypothetical protein
MAADVPAGLGYLGGTMTASAGLVVWIRRRQPISGWWIGRIRRPLVDGQRRSRARFWFWLPAVVGLPVLVLVLAASAVAEFRR